MSTALTAPPSCHTQEAADGYIDVSRRLYRLGVRLTLTTLPWQDAAIWDSQTQTLHLNRQSSLTEQLVTMCQMWQRITVGPSASTAQPIPAIRPLR